MRICVIGTEALEVADGYCRVTHFEMNTLTLTLFLLRAHTTTYGGQRRTLFDDGCRTEDVAFLQRLDETRDVDIHRTTLYTGRILAVETTMGFGDGLFEGQTLVDFLVERFYAHFRS